MFYYAGASEPSRILSESALPDAPVMTEAELFEAGVGFTVRRWFAAALRAVAHGEQRLAARVEPGYCPRPVPAR